MNNTALIITAAVDQLKRAPLPDYNLIEQLGKLLPPKQICSETPKVGVGVFIRRPSYAIPDGENSQYLLLLRKNKEGFGDNEWSLPGGKVDLMEDPIEAARREVWEEVGMYVEELEFLDYTNDIWPELNKHYITLYYLAKGSDKFKNMEPNKCEQIAWIGINAIPSLSLFCGINKIRSKHYMTLCRSNQ